MAMLERARAMIGRRRADIRIGAWVLCGIYGTISAQVAAGGTLFDRVLF